MSKPSSTDDIAATMALLWRSPDSGPAPASPGPKPRLDVDAIVGAAIAVADTSGSISMRSVAERLGVTAMTLYGYVPGKDALVALMYDAVHAEMPEGGRHEEGWRRQVTTWAEDLVALYVRHPWALGVSYARPVLGPHEQRTLETLVQMLRDSLLGPGLLRRVVGILLHVVRGTSLTIAEAREAAETGKSEREWWNEATVALSNVVPDFADRFPNTVWLLSQTTDPPLHDETGYVARESMANLTLGLDVLFDGVAQAVGATEGGA